MAESDFDLYFDVLQTLERLEIDYVIIGAFAGVSYGVTRATFDAWVAKPEDVIVGKLMAWSESGSLKHESDIRDILISVNLGEDREISSQFNFAYIDNWARQLG